MASIDEDRMVPPYEGRTTSRRDTPTNEDLAETVERQMARSDPGRPGATESPAEEIPVRPDEVARGARGTGDQSATDPSAATPKGAGASMTRGAEDVARREDEPGRKDLGTKGRSQRPVGTSDQRGSTGVDPQDLADDDMPNTVTSDEGG